MTGIRTVGTAERLAVLFVAQQFVFAVKKFPAVEYGTSVLFVFSGRSVPKLDYHRLLVLVHSVRVRSDVGYVACVVITQRTLVTRRLVANTI